MAKSMIGAAVVALAGATALTLSNVRTEEPKSAETPVEDMAKATTPVSDEVIKKLQRKVSFEFVETPLEEGLKFVEDMSKIKIAVSPNAEQKMKSPAIVSLKASDMDLATALKWILALCGMEYRIQNGGIMVDLMKPQPQPSGDAVARKAEDWELQYKNNFQRHVTFEFVDTPFSEAIHFLCDLTHANFILMPDAGKNMGDEKPVTLKVTDMPLESSFEQILKLADLDYDIRDKAIAIEAKGKVANPRHFSQISLPKEIKPPEAPRPAPKIVPVDSEF